MRATLGLVLTALPLLVATELPAAPPDAYSAAEIRGWVVDADTKQPLEGVHVVAQWILNTGLFFHSSHVTRLHILETVTDAQGEYHFPAWGPKPRPVLARLDWGTDPILTFFKPGYRVLSRNNYSPPPENEEEMAVRVSRWHGKTVALEPFRGTTDDWIRQLQLVQGRLGWGDRTEDIPPRLNDYWKHFPRTVLAVVEQRRQLPVELRHRVERLESWGVTEETLRRLVTSKEQGQ